MPRRRKAWLTNGTGVRIDRGRPLPGCYVEYNERIGGRVRHRSICFATPAAAKRWRDTYNARQELYRTGAILSADVLPITLSDAIREFVRSCSGLAPRTIDSYAQALALLAPHVAGRLVHEIAPDHILAFVSAYAETASPASAAKHARSLHRFFAWAVRSRHAATNPVAAVDGRHQHFERIRPVVTDQMVAALAAACETEDQRLAVWLAVSTGLDRGVIAALTTDHVDLHSRTIRYRRSKTGKYLAAPLHPDLAPLLARRLHPARPEAPLLAGVAHTGHSAADWWHRVRAAAGCPGVYFRDLRAVFVSRAQDQGGLSLTQVQRLAGHSSPETTARHYRMPDPQARQVLERLPLPGFPTPSKSTAQTPADGSAAGRRRPARPPAGRRRSSA